MSDNVAISIIIPVYNEEKLLVRCLNSVVKQSMHNIEVVVVDDASTDATGEVIKDYEKKYPSLVKGISLKKNLHQGGARNVGLRYAKGEYIMFVDSDDYIDENMCEMLYKKAKEKNDDITFCLIKEEMPDGATKKIVGKIFPEQLEGKKATAIVNMQAPWGKIIKKNVIIDNELYFPEKVFYEDAVNDPLLCLYSRTISMVYKPYYINFQKVNSTTRTTTLQRVLDYILCGKLFYEECMKRGIREKYKEFVDLKFFLSACQEPYKLASQLKSEEFTIAIKKIDEVLEGYEEQFNSNRLIRFLVESEYRKKLLPNYNADTTQLRKRILEDILQNKRLALWGAGKKGKDLIDIFPEIADRLICVVDKDEKKWGGSFTENLIVDSFDRNKNKIDTVIACNKNFYYDILYELDLKGVEKKIINYEIAVMINAFDFKE